MRRILENLDSRWVGAASVELAGHLAWLMNSLLESEAEYILAWIPHFRGEPDISGAIAEFVRSRKVFLPRLLPPFDMEFIEVSTDWNDSLEESDLGIKHPVRSSQSRVWTPAMASQSVILVPGLAFDKRGARIGRGKGHYDRFLAEAGAGIENRIGICWDLQIVPSIPLEEHDVLMDIICHERGVMRVNV